MIRKFFRSIVITLLTTEARVVLFKYRPKIIAVTGNVGKTSTKEAIYLALASHLNIRQSQKSYNSEIGVPLSVLGCPNVWGSARGWVGNLLRGLALIFFREPYPEWLVLEVGADRVGDIKKLARWLKPRIAVFTGVPAVPVHLEFFPTRSSLVAEKRRLLAAVRSGGVIVVNHDDPDSDDLLTWFKKHPAERSIITYGFSPGATFQASNEHYVYETENDFQSRGLTFKVGYDGKSIPLTIGGIFGKQQIYPALAALAVGTALKLNLVTLAQTLAEYQAPPGRGRLLQGEKGSLILDDSYNSSPVALAAALEALGAIKAMRRIAVLGDMMELGSQTVEAHRAAGGQIAKVADLLVTVGLRAKFIGEAAREAGLAAEKIMVFDDALTAASAFEPLIKAGDLILVKGSQSIRLEKLVEEIMAEPEKKAALLCRQEPEWQKRSG